MQKQRPRHTIAEMATDLLTLEGEHIEVVQSTAAGKRSVISDAELDVLLDRRKEVFEGRGVGEERRRGHQARANMGTNGWRGDAQAPSCGRGWRLVRGV